MHLRKARSFYMLRNRFYIGEVRYKNEICPGPQPPLMDRELFEAVQAKLTEQRSHHGDDENQIVRLCFVACCSMMPVTP